MNSKQIQPQTLSTPATSQMPTLVLRVENRSGVLTRVAALFSRRGFNIDSLAVAPTENERFSRITIVVDETSASIAQVVKQLDKLIDVVNITRLDPLESVERELLIATVATETRDKRSDVLDLVQIFDAQVLNVGHDVLMVSVSGAPRQLDDFEALLAPFGICEIQRTGKVALSQVSHVVG